MRHSDNDSLKSTGLPDRLLPLLLIPLTLLFFWKILLTNLILVGVDTFLYFYPYKAYAAEALRQGRLPLWNPHLFMGAPLLANSQVGVFYPLNWPLLWLAAPKQVAWSIGLHIALAGLLMYLLARSGLGLGRGGAWVAAALFAFGGYLGAQVEHINQLNAAVWLPLLFLLYDRGLTRHWGWFLGLTLVVALTLLAGHAQTVFIALFGLGLYALWQAGEEWVAPWTTRPETGDGRAGSPIKQRSAVGGRRSAAVNRPETGDRGPKTTANPRLASVKSFLSSLPLLLGPLFRHLWPLAAASVGAVGLTAIQLLPTAELSARSIRSGGLSLREVVAFSLPPTTLHFTLLPPFGLDLSQVWGEAFGEWVAYLGLSGLLLAGVGAVSAIWQPTARRFLFIAAAGLLLSLGLYSGPLYAGLYYLFPGFDLFRVPARWLLLYTFGAAILAGFGFNALHHPVELRRHLLALWTWLTVRRWRLILPALPLLGLILLLVRHRPPPLTLGGWLIITLVTVGLIASLLRASPRPHGQPLVTTALGLILIAELFIAAQALNYNQPTAPQAYHSLRNAVAFLLAADPPAEIAGPPPDRFLSLSGITYDPGDLGDLERLYGDRLSTQGLYNLVVAAKEKEVLFFNLPLLYGLHSVDGYDGGILPLTRFVTLQRLFLPEDELSIDGRLREKLRFVPPGRLLSLLNTRWIITDKQFDAWIDDIFYDLQFPARLTTDQAIQTTDIPDFPATAIGLVSHLEGAAQLPAGSPVAHIRLTFADGQQQQIALRAGADTAEGSYPPDAAHPQAAIGVPWPYEAGGVDYVTVYQLETVTLTDGQESPGDRVTDRLPLSRRVTAITVEAVLPEGMFVLRGVSLIHQPTLTSRSVILSTEGQYRQVHSGDVKIYENLGALPRAFVVPDVEVVSDEAQAIARLQDPAFEPTQTLVRLTDDSGPADSQPTGPPAPGDTVEITRYEPERVDINVDLGNPGWLVLLDTDYPGWQATLDGQPADIVTANLLFRSVAVPAGAHEVSFIYRPRSLYIGMIVSGVSLMILVGGVLVAWRGRAMSYAVERQTHSE